MGQDNGNPGLLARAATFKEMIVMLEDIKAKLLSVHTYLEQLRGYL